MLRRLYPDQPESFAFTPANQAWAEAQISKYPEGRQASAIIPLLWRAQEQEGWLSRAAIEHVAEELGLAYIRALEVATFYFMFQLQPVGSVAHFQICGTTSCMICGAEDLIAVCKDKIAARAHELSADGKFSWEEVECLGACSNAPMAQIGKDYYEDLTAERFGEIIEELAAGKIPVPGPQNGRFASEPASGLTSLTQLQDKRPEHNASAALAMSLGDTVKRIDGSEVPLVAPWRDGASETISRTEEDAAKIAARSDAPPKAEIEAEKIARPEEGTVAPEPEGDPTDVPQTSAGADDLKLLKGVGPTIEKKLHANGVTTFAQIAAWSPEDVAAMDDKLAFKGRIDRDGWIEQAKVLAAGGQTEFSSRTNS
jgi:NADH-quinone oxidoreductase subunit E